MVCKPQRTYDHAPDRSAHLTRRKGIRRSPLSTLAHRCRSSCSAYSSVVMTQLLAHTLTDTSHEAKPSRCSLQCLMRFRPTTGIALPTRPGEELCVRTATCTKFRKQKQDAAVRTILNTPALSLPYLATSGYLTSTEIKCLELPLPCLGALTLGVLGIVHILLKAVLAS